MAFVTGWKDRPECKACGLWKKGKHPFIPPVVETPGQTVDLAFVGEAPGKTEDEQGEYFCGKAGRLLDDILDVSPFTGANIAFFNAVQCWPGPGADGGDAKPTTEQMRCCRPLLLKNLGLVGPAAQPLSAIVAVGQWGARALLNDGTATLRGKRPCRLRRLTVPDLEVQPRLVTATYHPAAVFYGQPNLRNVIVEDLQWVHSQLETGGEGETSFSQATPEWVEQLTGPVSLDAEYNPEDGTLYSLAFTTTQEPRAVLLQHPEVANLDADKWRSALGKMLLTPGIILVGHNLPADLGALARFGVRLPEMVRLWDTLTASRIKWHNDPDRSLETLAAAKLGMPDYAMVITPYKRKFGGAFGGNAPGAVLLSYNVGDTVAAWRLRELLRGEMPPALFAMLMEAEYNLVLSTWDGQQVDSKALKQVLTTGEREVSSCLKRLRQTVGIKDFNYRTDEHKDYPFRVLKWEAQTWGKEGPSLNEDLLKHYLRNGKPRDKAFADALLKLKRAEAKHNRTRKDIAENLDANGRVHAQFNTAKARTLRFSAEKPNFQSLEAAIRGLFVSRWR